MFLEQADEVGGGIEVQLDGDVGNRERGVFQLSAGFGQYLVEDVGLGRLAERLTHDFVQVVGRDAEAVGIELRAVLLAEVVTYELYEVIHIAAHGNVRQAALNGLHLLRIHHRHSLQEHHRLVEHGPQDVLVFLGIVCNLVAHFLIEREDALKGCFVRHQERTAAVCLQIGEMIEEVRVAEKRQKELLLKHQIQRIQLRIVLERPHLARNGADNQPETNIMFGTYYLSELIRRGDGSLLRAFFSYNAGFRKVTTWLNSSMMDFGKAGNLDMDLFLETIPVSETREYGRKLVSATIMYEYLYSDTDLSDYTAFAQTVENLLQ